MLTIEQAKEELRIAVANNPGPWGSHSESVAKNAMLIAGKVPGMDSEKAYIMGLLHDIGRRVGVTGMHHMIDGYEYLLEMEEEELADIRITHSYPVKNVEYFEGKHDCTQGQIAFLRNFLLEKEYNDYDRLIQLCDAISLPGGACIAEKRFVDVALRHGVQDYTTKRWRAYLELKKYFDSLCGCDIYTLLPKVFENSMTNLL